MSLQPLLIKQLFPALAIAVSIFPCSGYAMEAFAGISVNGAHLDANPGRTIHDQESDLRLDLALSIKSLDNYWDKSSFGYYIEFGLDTYKVKRHDVWGIAPAPLEHIYTSSSGEYLYLTPAIFYNFNKDESADWSFKIGAGLGIGYLSIDGTILVNQPVLAIEPIHGSTFGYSTGVIIRYAYKNLVIQMKQFTPNGNIDKFELELQLPVITIGYKLRL